MIVQPTLFYHPKFLGLARKLGGVDTALGVLLRIWAHCQTEKKSHWDEGNADYVAAVCAWTGDPDRLMDALRFPMGAGSSAWVRMVEDGGLEICGWRETNATLFASWGNRRLGEDKKKEEARLKASADTSVDGSVDHGQTTLSGSGSKVNGCRNGEASADGSGDVPGNIHGSSVDGSPVLPRNIRGALDKIREEKRLPPLPSLESDSGGKKGKNRAEKYDADVARFEAEKSRPEKTGAAEIPTAAEMFEFFQARGAAVTAEVCGKYAEYHAGARTWIRRSGLGVEFVRDWQREVPQWQLRERTASGAYGGTKPHAQGLREELDSVEAQLQGQTRATHPGGPEGWDRLVAEEQRLRGILGAGGGK